MLGTIKAVAGFANKLLGFGERADKRQERRQDMQDGAKLSEAEELRKENEELRKDLAVYARSGGMLSNLARAIRRAKLRESASDDG